VCFGSAASRRKPIRPVLKHGPRSLTCARVIGLYETHRRNEGKGSSIGCRGGIPDWIPLQRGGLGRTTGPSRPLLLGEAAQERTRWDPKDGELCLSRAKPGETLVEARCAILTCKSIVRLGYRGERLIEPSSSWFPPKFPSG
jgi:hypothetical protein